MWDLVVLTAGSKEQKMAFEKQLENIDLSKYCRKGGKAIVVADEPEGLRIGSGGSTVLIINFLKSLFSTNDQINSKKVLLCHSGGLSQRMPHLSAFGKIFANLPNGKTILETKLEIYRKYLVDNLPSGLMITASDVLEDMGSIGSNLRDREDLDFVIFAHVSSLEVASQHGVFVLDQQKALKCVLQKPKIEEMEKEGALLDGNKVALTDSCFHMSWRICSKLVANHIFGANEPITEELCCYGDFMRPMGYSPKLDYIQKSSPKLAEYRKVLADTFSEAKIEIVNLGVDSFFHLGTMNEFLENISETSNCFKKVILKGSDGEISKNEKPRTNSFVEFSRFDDSQMDSSEAADDWKNCIISGVEINMAGSGIRRENVVLLTLALREELGEIRFVTVIFHIDDDIKKVQNEIIWNGHKTGVANCSLWDAPIFKTAKSRKNSYEQTISDWENGFEGNATKKEHRISIADAIKMHDMDEELKWRKNFR